MYNYLLIVYASLKLEILDISFPLKALSLQLLSLMIFYYDFSESSYHLQLHIIFNFEEMRDEFSTGYFSFASWEILQISMFAL